MMVCVSAAKSQVAPPVVPMGDNTYSITREAGNGFTRDTDKLKAEAMDDAVKFCASQGKQLKVVTTSEEKPLYTLGYAKAKIIFKALDAGDPELTREPAPLVLSEKPAVAGDLYTELLKLDDLRKRGILTDEEFQSEKKKVLKHSK